MRWRITYKLFPKFIAECTVERIINTGQYLSYHKKDCVHGCFILTHMVYKQRVAAVKTASLVSAWFRVKKESDKDATSHHAMVWQHIVEWTGLSGVNCCTLHKTEGTGRHALSHMHSQSTVCQRRRRLDITRHMTAIKLQKTMRRIPCTHWVQSTGFQHYRKLTLNKSQYSVI